MQQSYSQPTSDNSSSLRFQLDAQKLINKIKADLGMKRVKKADGNGGVDVVWVVDKESNLLNKEGINNLLAVARANIDKNTNLSEYSDKEIMRLMKHLHHSLRKHLVRNWHEYNIRDNTVATEIMEIVTNPILSAYKRAKGGAEKELISKTISSKELIKEKDEKKKSGFFGLGGDN